MSLKENQPPTSGTPTVTGPPENASCSWGRTIPAWLHAADPTGAAPCTVYVKSTPRTLLAQPGPAFWTTPLNTAHFASPLLARKQSVVLTVPTATTLAAAGPGAIGLSVP